MTSSDLTPLAPQAGISSDQELVDDLGSLLEEREGVKPNTYVDDKGIPTIGIGVNLRAFSTDYFTEMKIVDQNEQKALRNIFNNTYTDGNSQGVSANLNSDLANAMVPYGGVGKLTMSSTQIEDLYKQMMLGDPVTGENPGTTTLAMLPAFKAFLSNNNLSSDLLTSQESVALLSLYFNNPGTLLPAGGHLVSDLKQGNFDQDRADAWFQIRYNSNDGALTTSNIGDGHKGTAIRRDIESTLFGLYNPADMLKGVVTPPLAEVSERV